MIFKRFLSGSKINFSVDAVKNINLKTLEQDSYTNVSPKIKSLINKNLYNLQYHPLCLLKERILKFFQKNYVNSRGNAIFSVLDNLNPVVNLNQNFDSLLIPKNHPSRSKSDCYYFNKDLMLRSHMTAHQYEFIKMGFNNFLTVGDVYRRDAIDSTHYPVFHQLDGVKLFSPLELFADEDDGIKRFEIIVKEQTKLRNNEKQEVYTCEASKLVEKHLKSTLENLSKDLFGSDIQFKWVEAYFPFTHPSWELEILLNDKWIEILGCGIVENKILERAGCPDKIGWAFGLGLERLAMIYYSIPDIRIFWSEDPGFLNQFKGKSCNDRIVFKPFSIYPPTYFDISFWVTDQFDCNNFYELTREVCGDIVEEASLIDVYNCKKTNKTSYCFRIVYRSLFKTFTISELREIHGKLEKEVANEFNVVIR